MTSASTLLDNLNDQQRAAVECVAGPLLIFAGAGTGKTRVVTHRIAYLISHVGVLPDNILALTFTNKAAAEMRERLDGLLGARDRGVFMGTFHRFCARLLRDHPEAAGLPKRFSIYDDADSKHLIRQILKELNLDPTAIRPDSVAGVIDQAKNNLWTPETVIKTAGSSLAEAAGRVYQRYEQRLREAGAVDFGGLLMSALQVLDGNAAIRGHYEERFQYIHVDEYQDTNVAQYQLVVRLAKRHGNLCVVGDDDQAIYSWRGADLRNILSFERDFPGARVVKLEQNYRSTQPILAAAHSVVKNNLDRCGKELFTQITGGAKPVVRMAIDGRGESSHVALMIEREAGTTGYSNIAVLYRTASQSRMFEEEFLARGIPYVVVSGVGFYERREIKDLLSYLRLLVNPADDLALMRVINVPKRLIGERTILGLREAARRARVPMLRAIEDIAGVDINTGAAARLVEFRQFIESLRQEAMDMDVGEILRRLVSRTQYMDYLQKSDPAGFEEREANVQELFAVGDEYMRRSTSASLDEFVEELALLTDMDRAGEGDPERVSLMTFHAAKGLEFDVVFMVGMEEGLMPHVSAFESSDELEEERRLCYVGMTRARRALYLSYACRRMRFGQTHDDLRPSRFLRESGLLDVDPSVSRPAMSRPNDRRLGAARRFGPAELAEGVDTVWPDDAADEYGVTPGQRVLHPVLGPGKLVKLSGSGEDAVCEVVFDRVGRKKLKALYAKLTPIV